MEKIIPHILIVDDDPNLLATMRDILKLKGFEPVIAQTGAAALAQLEAHSFDLALLDLRLEDMSGLKVLSAIKERSPETECILLTGHASQNSAIEAIQMGVYGFFQKPFDMEQVLLSIQRAMERRIAEKNLRESERFAQATVNALSAHLAILDETGTILAVNHAWREFAKDNSTGDLHLKLCEGANYLTVCDTSKGRDSEEASVMAAGIRAVISGAKKEFLLEYPCHSPNEKRWFTTRVTRFPGEGALRIVVAHENISERKQAEEALHRSEHRYRGLFEDSPIAIWEEDFSEVKKHLDYLKGQGITDFREYFASHPEAILECAALIIILDANNAALQMYKAKSKDELFESTYQSLSKGEQEYLQEDFIKIAEGKTSNTWEGGDETVTGEPIEISLSWSVSPDHQDNFAKVLVTTIDITQRKRAEEAVLESEERFRVIFEKANDAIHIENADDKILAVNSRMCELMGYSREELLNMHVTDLQAPEMRQQGNVLKNEFARHGTTIFETLNLHRDGRRIPVEISIGTIELPGGELYISVVRDVTERKQAEEALRNNEKRFRALIENGRDNISLLTADGTLLWESPSTFSTLGYAFDQFVGRNLFELMHPDDLGPIQDQYVQLVQTPGGKQDGIFRLRHNDGRWLWIESTAANMLNEPSVQAIVINYRDITERKQIEDELLQSDQRFQQLANNIQETFWITDAESGREIYISSAAEKIWGISLEALYQGRYLFLENILPEDKQIALDAIERQLHGAKTEMEYRIQHPDGSVHWIWDRAFPIVDETGKVLRVAGITADITERKRAEGQIRILSRALEQSPTSIIITDLEGNIEYVNPKFSEVTGYSLEEAIGQNTRILKSDTTTLAEYKKLWNTITSGNVWQGEFLNKKKNGETYWENVIITPVFSDSGNISNFLALKEDITERKQAQEAQKQSELQFRALFELSPDAVMLIDPYDPDISWPILDCNTAACQMNGYGRDELIGHSIDTINLKPDTPSNRNAYIKRIREIGNVQLETFHRHKNGTVFPIEVSTSLIKIGNRELMIGIDRDITERKRAEEALHESEERFKDAFQYSAIGMALVSLEGKWLKVNSKLCSILGYSEDELLTRTFQDITHPDDLDIDLNYLNQLLSGEIKSYTMEKRYFTKEGKIVWALLAVALATNRAGAPQYFISQINDITERKQAEEALRTSTLIIERIINTIPVRVFWKDKNLAYLGCNTKFAHDAGFTDPKDVIGKDDYQMGWHDQAELYRSDDRQVIESGSSRLHIEESQTTPEGKKITLLTSKVPLRNSEGEISGVLGTYMDITERKQFEEVLLESEKRFRSLFENMLNGFAYCQMLFDGERPQDFIYLDVNRAFETLTGLKGVIGKKASEAIPGIRESDPELIEMYGRVAATGIPEIFEVYVEALKMWFAISVYCPQKEYFVSVFDVITERKQAEIALVESQRRLTTLMASLPGMAFRCKNDPEWTMDFVSEGCYSLTGYRPAELINSASLTYGQIIHSEDREMTWDVIQASLEKKQPYELNYRIITASGKERWVWEQGQGVYDPAGNLLALEGFIEDVTERKQVEEALRESESLYRQAIEVAGAVPYLQSYGGNNGSYIHYDFIGEEIRQITGYGADEFTGVLWDSLIEESVLMGDLANYSMEEAIRRVRTGETSLWKCEYRIHTRDGKIRWVFEAAVELYAENGIAKGSIGMFQDITERKQAEDLLRKSEKRYHDLFEDSPIALREEDFSAVKQRLNTLRQEGVTDFHTYLAIHPEVVVECAKMVKIREVNKAALKMYGADSKNSMPNGLAEILGTAYEHFRGQLAKIAEGQTEFTWEGTDHTIDGRQIDVEVNWSIAAGYENDLSKVIVSLQDISARKQADQAIHQRVVELGLLYESGLVFSQLLNPKEIARKIIELLGEKLDWHHTAIRLIRAQDELELVAFDQPGLEDNSEAQAVETRFNKLITRVGEGLSGWALQQSRTVRVGDVGSDPHYVATYPGLHSGLYVPLKSGNHMLGVISIESEKPNAFNEADEQLLTTLANQAANAFENARLFQTARQEIIERKRIESLLADERNQLAQRVEERTSALSRVNADLANAVRVKDEFLASMSHELRTPLTGILGLSEVLQLKIYGELNEKQSSTLKIIEDSGRHLLDLINDILDLSKIEAGRLELQFAPYSLADICQASLQLTKGMAQQKRQVVHYTPPAAPIIIQVDARRVKQLLVNLLSNAIKFTPENGELGLEIEANQPERNVKLTVWDKGIGIKSENLSKLFKPFTQLDSGLAREYSGTGLGLSLVRHLTEMHNGGIEVESNFGQGSRFTIILPWSPQNTTPLPYAMRRGNTGGLNNLSLPPHSKLPLVMYVDDNEMVLQMVADFLEAKQYRVIKVRSGLELLERAAEYHPNIMLVDIQMPGIGGLETIRRIRAHPDPIVGKVPVIAVTALAMPTDRERCLRAGANEYMSKPLKLKELAAVIQKLLERK